MTAPGGLDNPLAAWLALPYEFTLEKSIFGSTDSGAIMRMVDEFCMARLGSPVSALLSYIASLGCVFIVELHDGRRLVLKAFPPADSVIFMESIARIQTHLAARGFPCPRPLGGPWPFAHTHAMVMECRDEGAFVTADDPAIRQALAQALAHQIALTQDFNDLLSALRPCFWTRLPVDRLYPKPHLALFDLDAAEHKAQWIDRIARQARAAVGEDGSRMVIGHDDWAVKDVRFIGTIINVIYDWDSLRRDRESLLVGRAAGMFMMTYQVSHPVRIVPSPEEVRAFIEEYEAARRFPFTKSERVTMAAVAAYMIAWTARLEHSVAPDATDCPAGKYLAALAHYGDAYLRL
jgi:hypothetical protein